VKRWSGEGQPISTPWMQMALEFLSTRQKDPAAASRAYALVAVAAYDATVATWNAKYKYNRPAPDVVDRHWRMDNEVGKEVGLAVVERAKADGAPAFVAK